MVRKWVTLLVVIVLAGGGYYYYQTQLSSSFLSKGSIKFNGADTPVQTKAGLKERGLRLRLIPNGKNAAIGYVEASNLYKKPRGNDEGLLLHVAANAWVTDGHFARWFESNEKCLASLHAATRKPDCQFPYFGKESDTLAQLPLPQLSTMMDFTRLLVCEGKRYEHEGNHSKALDCYFAASRVAEHMDKSDSFAVSKLQVTACHSVVNLAVEGCVASGKLSEADLRRVVDHFQDSTAECPTLADALKAERTSGDNLIKALERKPNDAARVFPNNVPPDQVRALVEIVRRDGDGVRSRCKQVWGELKKWSGLPAQEAFRPGRDWDAYLRNLPPTYVFPRIVTGALGQISRAFVKCKAELGGVAIFAAIKLYEKKNGRPPNSLSQLTGDCISKLPKDPFTGRDYVYKVRGNEWVLYSVSDDLTDNGGAGHMPPDYKQDKDLVFWSKPIPVAPAPK